MLLGNKERKSEELCRLTDYLVSVNGVLQAKRVSDENE